MRVNVVMPQMGESIAEGTITRWLKKIGDAVARDEPIFEISTDKSDAEIPSPSDGVLVVVNHAEGATVQVNSVVAVIETDRAGSARGARSEERAAEPRRQPAREEPGQQEAKRPAAAAETASGGNGERASAEARFVSPVVRRIADEHGIDPERVPGTGAGGRVTKKDILAFIERAPAAPATAPAEPAKSAAARPAVPEPWSGSEPGPRPAVTARQLDAPTFSAGEKVARVGMTQMRRRIAEHMIESRRTSAHVHSVFEVDMSRVVGLRERYRALYAERHGTKLTFMPFFIKAVCDALRAWPIVNASVEGEEIVYHKELNVGIAVALDWGLIVPVVRHADELSLAGLSKRVNDLAERARTKKLNPDEVHGGTFTITNPGVFGGLYGLPIINQPQVAILGVGGIEKRPVVIHDAIAIRSMMYMAMSYDHRVVDGAVADQFLARLKHALENFDESLL
jgi:2-oxoglutarate dehydrogenase E2 component (dihydrolipoamide succinyltransferase)